MKAVSIARPRPFLFFAAILLAYLMHGVAKNAATQRPGPLLVGYFPQWGLYYAQPYYVKTLVTNGGAARLDQINYAQGFVSHGQCSVADPGADLGIALSSEESVDGKSDNPNSPFRGYFHQLEKLKHRYPHLAILISLEGDPRDFAQDAQPENRKAFVASCIDRFLRGHFAPGIHKPGIFDGFDIDWESPQEKDAANFRALLEEFRTQMNSVRPGLRLSIAVDESPQALPGTDFAAIAPLVDQIGIMNYDYSGPWSHITGFLAPLFSTDPRDSHSIERSIASYVAAGVPAKKLLMGLPFYGYSWTEVSDANDGLFQTGQAVPEDRPYHHIRNLASRFSAFRDERSQEPWLFDGQTFWTYEDPISIRYKVSYASHQHLGGVMIWELSGDTEDAELLGIVYRSLHDPIEAKIFQDRGTVQSPVQSPSQDIPAQRK